MDWTAIGAVGELVGAVAVVVSLIYLSRQVRQNTRALRTANAATVKQNFQTIARAFITDRGASDIVLRALKRDELTPAEQLSAYAWFFDVLKSGELAYSQYRSGDLDEAVSYALEHRGERPKSSAIYGGGAAGIPMDSPDAIHMLMTMALDTIQAYPF